jgi:hypothetical protein
MSQVLPQSDELMSVRGRTVNQLVQVAMTVLRNPEPIANTSRRGPKKRGPSYDELAKFAAENPPPASWYNEPPADLTKPE